MVDVVYVRGWQDCLDALDTIIEKAKTLQEVKEKIERLQELIRKNKFEKIRYELGAYGVF
jgi:translation elongation factor EF-4